VDNEVTGLQRQEECEEYLVQMVRVADVWTLLGISAINEVVADVGNEDGATWRV
jgi:hypothetical protein